MRIAIIGTGISGMTSAYLLSEDHEVVVFEINDYVGGHTNTADVSLNGQQYSVDTGFIVFNEKTYPNFLKLMKRLGINIDTVTLGGTFGGRYHTPRYGIVMTGRHIFKRSQ